MRAHTRLVLCATTALLGVTTADAKAPTAPDVDLPTMVAFEAATFSMGVELQSPSAYGDSWYIDQTPAHDVTLGAFHLDPFEVTVSQFALFLSYAAGEYHFHPDQPIERLEWGYDAVEGAGALPIHQVTWEAAHHYCLWAGKRLPTEAEWEFAAAGTEARTYPWGDDGPNCDRAAYFTSTTHCEEGPIAVGLHPVGVTPDGVYDLAGNVAEWVADRYGDYPDGAQTDPTGPDEGNLRVIRGGGFLEWSQALRTHTRRGADPAARSANVGFRCAWSEEPTDGALRGDLSPPEDVGRELTDRPLAEPVQRPEVLAEGLTQPTEIVELDGVLYVLDEGEEAVFRVDDGSPVPALLTDDLVGPVDLATDGIDLFVADCDAEEILRVATDGSIEVLATGQAELTRVLVGDGEVFWVSDEGIMFLGDNDEPARLADLAAITHVSLSDDHVYYTAEEGSDGADELGRVPRGGGDPEVLVGAFSSGYYPWGAWYGLDEHTVYYLVRRASWPSSVEVCELPIGSGANCFAHAPPKADQPLVYGGVLYMTSQYVPVQIDLATDWTYSEITPWSNAKRLLLLDGVVVWADASTGRIYSR
jgi:formylglycine-generating enzyme required for sulfatase activity